MAQILPGELYNVGISPEQHLSGILKEPAHHLGRERARPGGSDWLAAVPAFLDALSPPQSPLLCLVLPVRAGARRDPWVLAWSLQLLFQHLWPPLQPRSPSLPVALPNFHVLPQQSQPKAVWRRWHQVLPSVPTRVLTGHPLVPPSPAG